MNDAICMIKGRILFRNSDNRPFMVTELGHWSDIVSQYEDRCSVKWFSGDMFVSREGDIFTISDLKLDRFSEVGL